MSLQWARQGWLVEAVVEDEVCCRDPCVSLICLDHTLMMGNLHRSEYAQHFTTWIYKYSIICLALSLCQERWFWWSGEGSWWPGDQLRDYWCRSNEKWRVRGGPCNFLFFHMEVICLRLHAGKEAASDGVEREVGGRFRMGGLRYTHGWFMLMYGKNHHNIV